MHILTLRRVALGTLGTVLALLAGVATYDTGYYFFAWTRPVSTLMAVIVGAITWCAPFTLESIFRARDFTTADAKLRALFAIVPLVLLPAWLAESGQARSLASLAVLYGLGWGLTLAAPWESVPTAREDTFSANGGVEGENHPL
jgi:hypothetical protein